MVILGTNTVSRMIFPSRFPATSMLRSIAVTAPLQSHNGTNEDDTGHKILRRTFGVEGGCVLSSPPNPFLRLLYPGRVQVVAASVPLARNGRSDALGLSHVGDSTRLRESGRGWAHAATRCPEPTARPLVLRDHIRRGDSLTHVYGHISVGPRRVIRLATKLHSILQTASATFEHASRRLARAEE